MNFPRINRAVRILERRPLISRRELIDELLQRNELPSFDQVELLHEEDEVLERRVEMRLLAELDDLREMLMVDVGVYLQSLRRSNVSHKFVVVEKN